ncbi:L-2-hydroxyglutarate oxidase [Candidatus Nitronereus thalassa]|uniref:L-2-hydroxyglutarate oxidase n=1 Tax=Candidatus Nitronereus thalassa TaxID=3020898 RepID=A0ABU3K5E8_9BACT|nr:L-2-hydroxyglutarate oxidase [Candidatus Nitronereus thalassa]MDT7041620.1 L-2-hydroxyglutarate oxidase [Candidatus Nitronereus thalassa]
MNPDFLIIGGGVVGISIARQLKKMYTDSAVRILEKEPECGLHASGRNSGVLHAGFYYSPDSLKAKFTRIGNQRLTEYCEEKHLAIHKCGKLVVAKDREDHASMDELVRRGVANGITLEHISEDEAKKIEPRVKTCERALFSPTTSTVNPREVMQAMTEDAIREGVQIDRGVQYVGRKGRTIRTSRDSYEAGYLVNAAGLFADHLARDFGFSERYRILPFKGLYLYSNEPAGAVRTNIYPVPDLRNPFLGVHVTVTVDGHMKIGPTAIPAFWREQYQGMENFSLADCVEILGRQLGLLVFSGFDFKRLAVEELKKYSRAHLVGLASHLMTGMDPSQFTTWGKPGIRAQLMDIKEKKLEMDFVVEGDQHSMHVLNAVSPGFTCSLPFSEYVCEKIQGVLGGKG